jgi:hypothetical protein
VIRSRSRTAPIVAVIVGTLLSLAAPSAAQTASPDKTRPATDLDAFMEKVLKRRDLNRQILEQYVLDEVEHVEVLGPGRMPLFRQRKDFTWYVREGLHVRSPVKVNGVSVGDDARKRYEEGWAGRERERLKKQAEKDREGKTGAVEDEPDVSDPASGTSPIPTPRFVSEAYFMDFKFEAGNYYLAGREQLDGHAVLKIEYYPTRMFGDDESRPERKRERERDRAQDERIERQMNKTALVTLWVDPAEHQIVKYTFDNVWMDFLPGAWLVRVDDIRAAMTMGQPFPGVWLPRELSVHAGVTLAAGSFEVEYGRRFSDYKQADVKSLIRIPKQDDDEPPAAGPLPFDDRPTDDFPLPLESGAEIEVAEDDGPGGVEPQAPAPQPAQEVVGEIRVHGNAFVLDSEVLRLAGIAVGQPLAPEAPEQIRQRLEKSGAFESVEVRKRYRSLDDPSDVALILLVHERQGHTSELVSEKPSTWARVKGRVMFLPILGYDDGYGFTYGGRFSTIGLFGGGERVSVPLTWGGTRRAAVEVERTFKSGPLTRVESTFGIAQRENPRYEIDDQRVTWTGRAERSFAGIVRAGVDTAQGTVDFGGLEDRLWTIGADIALDTRGDPAFPRNAVRLGASWNALHVRGVQPTANRYVADARGYLGVIGQAVLAGRVQYATADAPVPIYERLLLGGAANLRGFDTGAFDGDRLLTASAELRVPVTSVLNGSKLGLTAFMDAGKALDVGEPFEQASWHRGVGGGVFLIAAIFRVNLDVAHGLKTGDTRVHLSSGFSF